jgi:hypothetical protein
MLTEITTTPEILEMVASSIENSFYADFCSFASFLITCSFFNQKDGNF